MSPASVAHLRRLGRAALGAALIAAVGLPALRNLPVLKDALVWAPLRWGLWGIGVLAIFVAAWQAWAAWAEGREAESSPPNRRFGLREALLDVGVVAALAGGGVAAHRSWMEVASPERVLSGYDFNTYALNALAAAKGEWFLFNGDKHGFHALVVAWLARGGNLRETMVELSVVCIGLFPAITYVLARRAGGRFAAVCSAILAFSCPLPWYFSTQTTAYPFFYAIVVVAAAAVLWAVQRPSPWSAVAAGLLVGVAAATQEKAPIVLAPVLGLALLLALPAAVRKLRARPLCAASALVVLPALAGLAFVGVLRSTAPPHRYTPMVSLVTNQRQEVHLELNYVWPVVKTPDVNDPAGIRRWLPRSWWNGEIESWVAAARTPPDSNSLRLEPEPDGKRNPWRVVPETSIAPLSLRLQSSLRSVPQVVGPVPWPGFVLLVLGASSCLFLARGRARLAVALVGAVATGLAPLTLKFGIHYFAHLVPMLAVLAMSGLDHLVRALLPGGWRWLGRGLVAWMAGAYALAFWTGDAEAWRSPTVRFPPPAALVPEDPGHYASNLQHVAAWLAAQPHPDVIVDCAPGSMLLEMTDDPRIQHVVGETACLDGLAKATPGTWLVASRHVSYRSPATPDPQKLLESGRWRLVYGWDGLRGPVPPRVLHLSLSALVVLEAV